jgi:hypothetical protein
MSPTAPPGAGPTAAASVKRHDALTQLLAQSIEVLGAGVIPVDGRRSAGPGAGSAASRRSLPLLLDQPPSLGPPSPLQRFDGFTSFIPVSSPELSGAPPGARSGHQTGGPTGGSAGPDPPASPVAPPGSRDSGAAQGGSGSGPGGNSVNALTLMTFVIIPALLLTTLTLAAARWGAGFALRLEQPG